jgi:hypothetical protein
MKGYPPNWPKVRDVIRRITGYCCEQCGARHKTRLPGSKMRIIISVHHAGFPYANGRPGDPSDKYDIRRENLIALCQDCHTLADLAYSQACSWAANARRFHERLCGPIVLLLPAPSNARSERYVV